MPVIDGFMRTDMPAGVEVFSVNVWESVPAPAKVFIEEKGYSDELAENLKIWVEDLLQ